MTDLKNTGSLENQLQRAMLLAKSKEYTDFLRLMRAIMKSEYDDDKSAKWEQAFFRAFIHQHSDVFGLSVYNVIGDMGTDDREINSQYETLYATMKARLRDEISIMDDAVKFLATLAAKKDQANNTSVVGIEKNVWNLGIEIVDLFDKFLSSLRANSPTTPDNAVTTRFRKTSRDLNDLLLSWEITTGCSSGVTKSTNVDDGKPTSSSSSSSSSFLGKNEKFTDVSYVPEKMLNNQLFNLDLRKSDNLAQKYFANNLFDKNQEVRKLNADGVAQNTNLSSQVVSEPSADKKKAAEKEKVVSAYDNLSSEQKKFVKKLPENKGGFFCELCPSIKLIDDNSLKSHVGGKNHLQKVRSNLAASTIPAKCEKAKKQKKKNKVATRTDEDLEFEKEKKHIGIQMELLSKKYCKYCDRALKNIDEIKRHSKEANHIANCSNTRAFKQKSKKPELNKDAIEHMIGTHVIFVDFGKDNALCCNLCRCSLPANNLDVIKQHMNGSNHQKKYQEFISETKSSCNAKPKEATTGKGPTKSKPKPSNSKECTSFYKTALQDVIDLQQVVAEQSVHFTVEGNSVFICRLCKENIISIPNVARHLSEKWHIENLKNVHI